MSEEFHKAVDVGGGEWSNKQLYAPKNSNKSKATPERPKNIPVATSDAVVRKPSAGRRILIAFKGDDPKDVVIYLLSDIVIPGLKSTLVETLQQGVTRLINGSEFVPTGVPMRTVQSLAARFIPYNQVSQKPAFVQNPYHQTTSQKQPLTKPHDYREILFPDRGTAEFALGTLRHLIDEYDYVSVSDLYKTVDMSSAFTDENYGWNDLTEAGIRRVSGGYVLVLPTPISLK